MVFLAGQPQPSPASPVHYCSAAYSNGRFDDEAQEPQQTLSSWGEFMAEEPVKPKGRSSKPQPAASLFDWALSLEQEYEKEPVGAGR